MSKEEREQRGVSRYMTMLKPDSNGAEALSYRFCYVVNFIEGSASPGQGTSDFVNKNCTSEATG